MIRSIGAFPHHTQEIDSRNVFNERRRPDVEYGVSMINENGWMGFIPRTYIVIGEWAFEWIKGMSWPWNNGQVGKSHVCRFFRTRNGGFKKWRRLLPFTRYVMSRT